MLSPERVSSYADPAHRTDDSSRHCNGSLPAHCFDLAPDRGFNGVLYSRPDLNKAAIALSVAWRRLGAQVLIPPDLRSGNAANFTARRRQLAGAWFGPPASPFCRKGPVRERRIAVIPSTIQIAGLKAFKTARSEDTGRHWGTTQAPGAGQRG